DPSVTAGLHVPYPDLAPVGATGRAPRQARRGGGPSAIGADRNARDAHGEVGPVGLEVPPVGEAVEMGLSLDIVPLPAAEIPRAAVKQAVGQGDVAII